MYYLSYKIICNQIWNMTFKYKLATKIMYIILLPENNIITLEAYIAEYLFWFFFKWLYSDDYILLTFINVYGIFKLYSRYISNINQLFYNFIMV